MSIVGALLGALCHNVVSNLFV
ncbi:hypothetical protein AGR8A_Cc30711 [Agrobacterium fabrum str. J-07]|nr:hypothetical protein AGR8A_Cc30711 [Agrobacterium fabrum str. J-07]